MPEAPKKMIVWRATSVGVCVAFQNARVGACKSDDESLHAEEIVDALRASWRSKKLAWDALKKMDAADDEAFDSALAALESCDPTVVRLSPGAFAWLRPLLAGLQMSGALAASRRRIVASVDAAKEESVDLAP